MSKQFEELSKDLAQGMSRRKAFWRFGAGLGAAALGLITRKPAQAQVDGRGKFCDEICKCNNDFGYENHGQCVATCVRDFTINGTFFCGVTG